MTILPSELMRPGNSRRACSTISAVAAGKNSSARKAGNSSSVTRPTLKAPIVRPLIPFFPLCLGLHPIPGRLEIRRRQIRPYRDLE